ncbi:DUF4235 domain-containing protein [Acidiferrimicrobium sp. IK]|uniref:DUF4235 domain-containing protein n=1 Tax=Acidiferrimicrobium sp. IK TaxID=2871700 RepID=UPI0021CB7D10|nr:DUF4235 domain-containing protein [Acidiferrimicrobium sp. IK]MCU4185336.1 DUF4235 domain-containing protein [Acidiferrimicrobium sp. IK]
MIAKIAYKPLGMAASVLGGIVATRLFAAAWKALGRGEDAPASTDARRSWPEVLSAAALQGAIFGLVKAATDRGGAVGFEKATGAWPGDE